MSSPFVRSVWMMTHTHKHAFIEADKLSKQLFYLKKKITKVLHFERREWIEWDEQRGREKVNLELHTEKEKEKENEERSKQAGRKRDEEAIILSIVVQVALNDGIVWHRSIQTKQNKYINYKAIVLRCKAIIWLPFKLSVVFFFWPECCLHRTKIIFCHIHYLLSRLLVSLVSLASHIWVDWCWYFAHDMFHCPLDGK